METPYDLRDDEPERFDVQAFDDQYLGMNTGMAYATTTTEDELRRVVSVLAEQHTNRLLDLPAAHFTVDEYPDLVRHLAPLGPGFGAFVGDSYVLDLSHHRTRGFALGAIDGWLRRQGHDVVVIPVPASRQAIDHLMKRWLGG